ncbi:uncharacterized protein METZ01_LOCUS250633, partial [marine metagenome]
MTIPVIFVYYLEKSTGVKKIIKYMFNKYKLLL